MLTERFILKVLCNFSLRNSCIVVVIMSPSLFSSPLRWQHILLPQQHVHQHVTGV